MDRNNLTTDLFQQAERIVDRAMNTASVLGVWLIDGKLKATKSTTQLFAQGCKDHPEKMVGCYNAKADPAWIVEDALATMDEAWSWAK